MTTISGAAPTSNKPTADGSLAGVAASQPDGGESWQEWLGRIKTTQSPAGSATPSAEAAWHPKKAVVVYRVDGIPAYFRDEDGVGVIESDADAALYGTARTEGEARGLVGEALDDYANNRFEQLMIDKHGEALAIERYGDAADAPSVGELLAEMEGAISGRSPEERLPPAVTALIQFQGDTLAQLHGAESVSTR